MRSPRPSLMLAGCAALLFFAVEAHAQAYCALRDPVQQIYDFYPNAKSYRSIVRTVDASARSAVQRRLPFSLHFNELGKHTLYAAVSGRRPLGLVHARSEIGRWGLIEVAWALDLELRVVDFRFQRCRSPHRKALESPAFRAFVRGKTFAEIRHLLSADGTRLAGNRTKLSSRAQPLAVAVLRSALKTIVVTDVVWKPDLKIMRLIRRGLDSFDGAESVQHLRNLYDERVLALIGGDESPVTRAGVVALLVHDGEGATLGAAVRTPFRLGDRVVVLWWNVDATGVIHGVDVEGDWPDPEVRAAARACMGSRELLGGSGGAVGRAAAEATAIGKVHTS